MTTRTLCSFSAILLAVSLAIPSYGVPLLGDPAAVISGVETFTSIGAPTGDLTADVEYAVYAPGAYPGPAPIDPTLFTYAYQILNDVGGTVDVSQLSVGVLPGHSIPAGSVDDDPGYGTLPFDKFPTAAGLASASVVWNFLGGLIDPGEISSTLIYQSPLPHIFTPSSVQNGGLSDTHDLPSPAPEPAAALLLTASAVALLRRR